MDRIQFGRRVAHWRDRRRLTQLEFAALMCRSLRWVEELEGGRRQADPNLSVATEIALRLDITLDRLLYDPVVLCPVESEIDAVRAALQRHDVITGRCDDSSAEPVPVAALRRSLVYARTGFQSGHFAKLGVQIPALLVDATRAAEYHQGDDRQEAYRLLSLSLELTEAAAIKWGDTELAVTAGHRAVAAAERSEDPVIMASAARHLADAMTSHGQAQAAVVFVTAAASRLQADLLQRGPEGLSVLGMLFLKAAMAQAAAAEADDRSHAALARAVPGFLDQAAEHADRLGRDDNLLWTSFGPTNCALYRVAAHVQLSEGADAIAVAADIPPPALTQLPRERRAHLLTDRAIAEKQAGQRETAVDTLLEAEELAPEEVVCRPRTKRLVEDLRLLGTGSAEGRLRGLAARCGLPG
ncbi:helix-turn-helix domain-containing protein [Streptomyces antarcticus]|uniref:helix-turn-helix domain-containing protein n=1 Tax=Streptomyces antarcticus TaxID=2996458 RepID=UPI00226D691A|nr:MULTISPECIES: helix-turn-helix transcriptional regulator [unclassified Streptomyces]MCY0947303.1 helix-turn-helix transcriptional regulator [Streptomyces sp. H34-AA3]MCZ4086548.1 helix-turn-helix transcriptional regulator [Streptomyces sp. H34-S5]